jgi:hypothetical protein
MQSLSAKFTARVRAVHANTTLPIHSPPAMRIPPHSITLLISVSFCMVYYCDLWLCFIQYDSASCNSFAEVGSTSGVSFVWVCWLFLFVRCLFLTRWINRSTYLVTRKRLLQLKQNLNGKSSSEDWFTCNTRWAFRRSDWSTSLGTLSHSDPSGHSSSGNFKNSGPYFHLPLGCWAGIPRETSSATYNSPRTCLH